MAAMPLDRGADPTQISFTVHEGTAEIRLERPRYRNAQSRVLLEEVDRAFDRAERDPSVKVVMLTAAGDHFSSGHDLGTPEEQADRAVRLTGDTMAQRHAEQWEKFGESALRWRDFPKPTLAVVQGYCIFGGWLIASAMDFVIAADDARFLPNLLQYFSVPWDIGVRRSKEVLFRGRFLTADEAASMGFVNHVVPRADLEQISRGIAADIAERDSFELRMIKVAVNSAHDHMGFRSSVVDGYSYYSLMMAEALGRDELIADKRFSWVDRALSQFDPEGGGTR